VNDLHFIFCVITPRYLSISTKCERSFRRAISPWELSQQIPQTLNSIKETHEKNLHVFFTCAYLSSCFVREKPPILGLLWLAITYFTFFAPSTILSIFAKNGSNLCLFKKKRKMKGHPKINK
jgi:hypothetical protein